jgi:hypothetical protein
MFKGLIVFFVTLTIILFPIPLKLTLKYKNKVLEIYIYNKKIKKKTPSEDKVNSYIKAIENIDFFKSLTFNDIRLITYKFMNLKFKPIIILNTKLEYGFDDAAFVAILYGIIHSTYGFTFLLLQNFFKVKKIDLKIIPHFEENDFNIQIKSIIYTNLGKTICMVFVILKCLKSIKRNRSKLKRYEGGNVHG